MFDILPTGIYSFICVHISYVVGIWWGFPPKNAILPLQRYYCKKVHFDFTKFCYKNQHEFYIRKTNSFVVDFIWQCSINKQFHNASKNVKEPNYLIKN